MMNMLKQQYKILRSLDHPNISKAYYLFVNEESKGIDIVTELF